MRNESSSMEPWELLIGYPLEEAQEALREQALSFQVEFTAAPGKERGSEGARVIAVRRAAPPVLVCASPDWTVSEVRWTK